MKAFHGYNHRIDEAQKEKHLSPVGAT